VGCYAARPMSRPAQLPPPEAKDVLYLLDLSGYVFRAYHALPPLTNAAGEPTHATYGTVQMIQKLVNERKPTYLGVALDTPGPSVRRELDARYKATRPPPPSDLAIQIARCHEIIEAYQIPSFKAPGFEADDVLAALVEKANAAGLFVVIASSDKDLMQLVTDRCIMWDPMRDRIYGAAEVEEKWLVPPAKLRDLLALVGDTSDNVPGVPSVGPKTAADLIKQWGDLDGVYAHLADIKRDKLRTALETHKDDAYLSRDLVTLRGSECPVVIDRAALTYGGADVPRLRELFTELGFVRQIGLLPQAKQVEATYRSTGDIADVAAVAAAAMKQKRLAIELVATSRDPMRTTLAGVAIGVEPGAALYVPVSHRYLGAPPQLAEKDVLEALRPALEAEDVEIIGHDLKFVDVALRRRGIHLRGPIFDSMLASYLLDPELANDIATIAERDASVRLTRFEEIAPKAKGKTAFPIDEWPVEDATRWAAQIPDAALRVRAETGKRIEDAGIGKVLRDIELPLSGILADMEERGVLVDLGALDQLGVTMSAELTKIEEEARAASGHADLNLGSPKQLETILFDELGLKATKKTKTGRSTDAEALEAIADEHPLPRMVLEHRAVAKLKGTYVDALPRLVHPKTGRIHGHWKQAVAATGRISSEEPNLQNIPIRTKLGKEIRRAFIAPPGQVFLAADYSQIELRVMAHLSHDPVLVDAFTKHQDVHLRTASEVFGVPPEQVTEEQRRKAKTINFGIIYGMGDVTLAKRLSVPKAEASKYIAAYFERHHGVRDFLDKTMADARKEERVHTMFGRIRTLPDLRSTDRMRRSYAERIAQNTPIQGSAADLLKMAMIALRDPVVPGARMILTVHDELDFEVPEDRAEEAAAKIKKAMSEVFPMDVPLVVDVGWGKTWADAH
jgi:DNA polymerase-1